MNAQRLLEHFERISEAPDAISRLRRFILDLAVSGKLVHQDNEEPVSQLSKLILADVNEGTSVVSPLTACEQPFQIPSLWIWIQVGDAAYVEMGQSPPSESYNRSGDGLPFFQGKSDFGKR